MNEYKQNKPDFGELAGVAFSATMPLPAICLGLYVLKSAIAAYFLYHGLCVLPALIWGKRYWTPYLRCINARELAVLTTVGVLFNFLTLCLYEYSGQIFLSDANVLKVLKDLGYSQALFIPLSLYTIFVNPLLEEFYWRGVVLSKLELIKDPPFKHFALVLSAFFYAAFHYPIFRMVLFPGWAELGTFMLAIYGLILGLIYKKTGSLITTAIAHAILTDTAAILLTIQLLIRTRSF